MRKLLLVLAVLLLASPVWATPVIYYVDCAANGDAGAGTSTAVDVAWKTIAKVNASSFAAGDSILFKKGCTWREQLTVPSSGSAGAGNAITFGAYGTGADPIFDGADLITPGTSWAAGSAWGTVANYTLADANGVYQARTVIPADKGTVSGTKVRLTIPAHSTSDTVLDHVTIGPSASGSTFDSTPTTITFSGVNGVTITANTTLVSDEVTFTFDKSTRYLIAFYCAAGSGSRLKRLTTGGDGTYYDWSTSTDTAGNLAMTTVNQDASTVFNLISKLEVLATSTTQWTTALTTEPKVMFFDGTVGNKQATLAAVDSTRDWYWAANVLTVYAASDPDTLYTTPGVEAGQRDYGLTGVSKDYVTVSGLNLTRTNIYGIFNDRGNSWTISGNSVSHTASGGIVGRGNPSGAGAITGLVISGNTIGQIDSASAWLNTQVGIAARGTTSAVISGNTIATVNTVGILTASGGASGAGADVSGSQIYGNTITSTINAISIFSDENASIYRNLIHDGTGAGISVQWASDNTQVYYNLIYNLGQSPSNDSYNGIDINNNTQGVKVYNNVVRNVERMCLTVEDTTAACDNAVIRNNIFDATSNGTGGYPVQVNAGITTVTFSNNVYVARSAAPTIVGMWKTVTKTLADWVTASGDTNSQQADPQFVSTVTPDFHLQHTSPCRDAGVDVSLTTDYAGKSVPYGSAPDCGAYEWRSAFMPLWIVGQTRPLTVPLPMRGFSPEVAHAAAGSRR